MVSFFSIVVAAAALVVTNGMHLRVDINDSVQAYSLDGHRELAGKKNKAPPHAAAPPAKKLKGAAAAPAAAPPAKKRHNEPMVLAMTVQPGSKKLKLHGLWPTTICNGSPANDMSGFVASAWSSTGKSPQNLAVHEYKRHGFCNYVGPSAYYTEAQSLGATAVAPTSFACPTGDLHIGSKKVKFTCKGKQLNEIRYCYNKGITWVSC
ncbi:Aste57867_19808 [Aphanomyces stellatus]|uniref:Aste57867_19808 protein n=1 Tax=Aphanomyces stellatus TaxID=120398 RepID=A0A485LDH3_9STRA|nr:hypothetical protein As57867_019743 [Aphanomyces stellatus]VFT96506.1 Aste57867_19808 [Aphanomyces stellatus]